MGLAGIHNCVGREATVVIEGESASYTLLTISVLSYMLLAPLECFLLILL